MAKPPSRGLSRRERQIMDALYRRGRATVAEVREELPDPPTASAVRAALRLLEQKGRVRHDRDGPRNVYLPSTPREEASRGALRHLVETFFRGSPTRAMSALLEEEGLSDEDLERLEALVRRARRARGDEEETA